MMEKARALGGFVFAAILALSLVAGVAQGLASATSDGGDDATLVARGPGGHNGGGQPRGVTWE